MTALFDEEPEAPLASEINTTPLIDVLLVLLIMVIVTIPIAPHLTGLGLPRPATAAEPLPDAVRVRVDLDGRVFWQDTPLDGPAALEDRLRALVTLPDPPPLHLDAEGGVSFGLVMAVLAAVQRHGVRDFAITDTRRFLEEE
ncbi:ExbD/TolR family protein [Pararhodospirillum oryzae]|uniref:Biopolymer transporter ExbD n=1 Tax=Pararhodospirillum oryzae TaxID=478448 RepID=A0A512HC74_9PROT|nr:biopolymer transporter ExbD [Pararhodospirillum oryzae]GEO83041.1 biopolymer transporter ExbD [Pararhodospirillum oryzae]